MAKSLPDDRSELTPREREVAALVAEGLTNREIAQRLFISERTADGHLEHIREKLGVRSRAQITAWVVGGSKVLADGSPPAPASATTTRAAVSTSRQRSLLALLAGIAAIALCASGVLLVRWRADSSAQAGGPRISTVVGFGQSGPDGGGESGDGGPPAAAQLREPQAVAAGGRGSYYVADTFNAKIRRVDTSGLISTVAGGAQAPFREGASGQSVSIGNIGTVSGLAVGPDGRLYFSSDLGAFRLDADGTLHQLLKTPHASWPGSIAGVAVDARGTVFLADRANHVVLRLVPDGSVSTYAGTGEFGFDGDGGAATGARLAMPTALALDSRGDLYIADSGDNRVRRVDASSGVIKTVAGSQDIYGYSGDGGQARRARLSLPSGLAVDAAGSLYIADTGNNRVRKVSPDGTIDTLIGTGAPGAKGDGGPASAAELYAPRGLAINQSGDLYIADAGNNRIRKLRLPGGGGAS